MQRGRSARLAPVRFKLVNLQLHMFGRFDCEKNVTLLSFIGSAAVSCNSQGESTTRGLALDVGSSRPGK